MIVLALAITVGMLFATGTYLILRRGQIKLLLGLGLLSHGVNLLLFGAGRLTKGSPPIIMSGHGEQVKRLTQAAAENLADPLPQALILTAIVISFGITAFVIVLVHRRHELTRSDVLQGEMATLLHHIDPFYHPADPQGERTMRQRQHQAWLLAQALEEDVDDIDVMEYLIQNNWRFDEQEEDDRGGPLPGPGGTP